MSKQPDCEGAHSVYADDGCNNAGCRDLDFCVEDCPSCPDHAKRLRADEKARQEKYLCKDGHPLENKFTTSYNEGIDTKCNKCWEKIEVSEGYYHCPIENSDYHNHCV